MKVQEEGSIHSIADTPAKLTFGCKTWLFVTFNKNIKDSENWKRMLLAGP